MDQTALLAEDVVYEMPQTGNACVWLEMSGDSLISRVVDYSPEPFDPPPGREHLVERW